MNPLRNPKKHHAAAAATSSAAEPTIPLSHPTRDHPSKKTSERTLYDIIAERQNELLGQEAASQTPSASAVGKGQLSQPRGTRFVTADASGKLVDTDADINSQIPVNLALEKTSTARTTQPTDDGDETETDHPLPPLLDTILLSLPLTTLHLTLAYLAAHQYAESTDVPRLLKESITITFPLLTFLIHFAHGHVISFRFKRNLGFLSPADALPVSIFPLTRDKFTFTFLRRLVFPPTVRTIVFLPVAALLGVHLITITNGEPYYAVMKKAPALGTMWIWCILEMSFGAAVLGALGPLVWGVWWMGYGIF